MEKHFIYQYKKHHQEHLRWHPCNQGASRYISPPDGQIAMDSIQGLSVIGFWCLDLPGRLLKGLFL